MDKVRNKAGNLNTLSTAITALIKEKNPEFETP